MGKNIKITEAQRQYLMSEGFTVDADVQAAGGDVVKAVNTAKEQIRQSGANPKDAKIQINAESRTISVKDLRNDRIKKLTEHAMHYTVKDFIQQFK